MGHLTMTTHIRGRLSSQG